jgi:hypothetical protein
MGANVALVGRNAGSAGIKGEQTAYDSPSKLNMNIRLGNVSATGLDFEIHLEKSGGYRVVVFDMAGKEVWKANGTSSSLHQKVEWRNAGIGNGTYVVVLSQNNRQAAREFVVVR